MLFRSALFVSLFCCVLYSPATHAVVLPGYAAGSGANTSNLVIDFAFVGGDAYFFQYHYDGDATAQDMLLALDAAGSLTVHHQFFEFEVEGQTVTSIYIDGFSYEGNAVVPGFEGDAGENWAYWIADEPGEFVFWTTPVVGATDRVLHDGSLDGWSLNVSAFNTKGLDPTYLPPAIPPIASIPGDVSGDGDIDDSDLGTAFANYTGPVGAAGGKTTMHGDTDADGDIDDTDLGTLLSSYTGPLAPASVPEPASVALLMLGLTALGRRRR